MFLVLRWFFFGLLVPGVGFWRAGKPHFAVAASLVLLPLPVALLLFSFSPHKFVWLVLFSFVVCLTAAVVQAALGARAARQPVARWPAVLGFSLGVFVLNNLAGQAFRTRVAPFNIPSEGMSPTLIPGDQFYVFSERTRFPVERGSVIVHTGERGVDYVKRVIGIEGDRVEWDGETLTLNGVALARGACEPDAPPGCHTEQLGPRRWRVLTGRGALPGSWQVPEDHVFAMGDNRDDSYDSRSVGPIEVDDVKGVVEVIHFSWPHVTRTGRPLDLAP